MNETIAAVRLRKNTFWIEGKSPDSFAKKLISAKQNADKTKKPIPFCLDESCIKINSSLNHINTITKLKIFHKNHFYFLEILHISSIFCTIQNRQKIILIPWCFNCLFCKTFIKSRGFIFVRYNSTSIVAVLLNACIAKKLNYIFAYALKLNRKCIA